MPYYLLLEPEELDEEPAEPLDEPLSPPDCFCVLEVAAAPVPDLSLQSFGMSALFGYLLMSHLSSLRATCLSGVVDVEDVVLGLEYVLDEVVVSVFGAFLSLCMSPRARAEPLASAMNVVMTKAGASLRIWSS